MTTLPIVVVGSINCDLILEQQRLPHIGETLRADSLREAFGGKGANQAVQAARLGATVRFIGAIGSDNKGSDSLANLRAQGIDCYLKTTSGASGLGVVNVLGNGEVHATIYAGANDEVTASWVRDHRPLITQAGMVIIQNEIPDEANTETIKMAAAAQVPVIYNAAPARPVSVHTSRACRWFIVNEDEATSYLGRPLGGTDTAIRQDLKDLHHYCDNVLLTLGSQGCYVASGSDMTYVAALPTRALDTTGAGDSFIGAFATSLLSGVEPKKAALYATRVASITVQSPGAQSSMPSRKDVDHETTRTSSDHP